jgi:molecular chaperone DnaJ
MEDAYATLGVGPRASSGEIRRAYQRLARRLHPDLNPGDPVAAERFREVSRAFAVLSDPDRRARHDRGESVEPEQRTEVPEVGFAGFDFSAEVPVARVDFKEIVEGVLRLGGGLPPTARGEDLEQRTPVSFADAYTGTTRRLSVTRFDRCHGCGGAGEQSVRTRACPACQGKGEVRTRRGRMIFNRRCPECEGSGQLGKRVCEDCRGEGRLLQAEWLDVRIPPGVASGSRVTIPAAGNAGRRGGPPGDLVLLVDVEEHPSFRREGDDLAVAVPLTLEEAAGGAHVEVPTLAGAVTIEVPAGTQPGQRFRLRKRGFPHLGGGGRGDLFVEARVVVPAVTDDEGRALLRELGRRCSQDVRRDLRGGLAPPSERGA